MNVNDVLVVGVGGQGVLLLSDILIRTFVRAGYDAKKSEVHGMAQRGGSVESHVRRGQKVHSPLIRPGRADVLVAMELLEAIRYSHWLRPGGVTIAADIRINPSTVGAGLAEYVKEPTATLRSVADGPVVIVDQSLAEAAGDARAINTVLLGALSRLATGIDREVWQEVLAERVPARAVDINLRAFEAGREIAD